jgi:hypothetical protein
MLVGKVDVQDVFMNSVELLLIWRRGEEKRNMIH